MPLSAISALAGGISGGAAIFINWQAGYRGGNIIPISAAAGYRGSIIGMAIMDIGMGWPISISVKNPILDNIPPRLYYIVH